MTKIEEILGYSSTKSKDTESVTRRYYVRDDDPAAAKTALEQYAKTLPIPAGLELGDVALDEEKNANNLYYGTITFQSPDSGSKTKTKIADDLFELYGERMSEGRRSGSHERLFRIKNATAKGALARLESYIRGTAETSGRLHISDISVDEEESDDGFYKGRVVYGNPDTFGSKDKINGIVPAYGDRYSATRGSRSREHVFELRGYATVQEAWQALANNYGNDIFVDTIEVEEDTSGGKQLFSGRVRYSMERENNDDDMRRSISFEVSGTQTKITSSLLTRGGWSSGGMPPRNYGGLIGVTNDGVEGVDIDTAVSTFSETVYFHPAMLTSGFIGFLTRSYGCVNSVPFKGFDVGEVRFLGATGSYRQGDRGVEMSFKFAVSPNAWNIRIGNILVPFKYGWDYLWVRWADMEVDGVTVKVPIEAYVEMVYRGMNFYNLGV